jgi:hypothetical protein
LLNENCKSTYIGEDRAIYCCFSKALVSEEYVNTLDGKSKPEQCEYDETETVVESSERMVIDDNSVFREGLEDTTEGPNNAKKYIKKGRPLIKKEMTASKRKAHFTKNLQLTSFDVTKRQIKIVNLYKKYIGRPKYINSLVNLCKHIHEETKYADYCNQLDKMEEERAEKELEETSNNDFGDDWFVFNNDSDLFATDNTNKPTVKTEKLTKPDFLQQNRVALEGLFLNDAQENNMVVPLYGRFDAFISKRHASRMSDPKTLDVVRSIIKDLLFNDNIRKALNCYYMDKTLVKAKVMIRSYYKHCLREKTRPIIHRADDIFDHHIENSKHFNLYPYNQNIVDFLSVIILDCWFLILSTPRYAKKSSDYDITKHTLSLLYRMRNDVRVDLIDPITKVQSIFVFLPKNNFLLHMLPDKREICEFQNSNSKKNFIAADIKSGTELFFQSIESIDDIAIKKQVFEEIRERFAIHRHYFLSNLERSTANQ